MIGREAPPSDHSNAEIAPPTEGLSSNRNFPAVGVTVIFEAISCPSDFKAIQWSAISLGINFTINLRVESRQRYFNAPGTGEGQQ
jgi:hypothetical protein